MGIEVGQIAEASDFINESEKHGTPANDNGRVPKLEEVEGEDAKLSPVWLPTKLPASQLIAASAANSEIANNTTTETDILSVQIDANTLGTGKAIRARIYVDDYTTAVGFTPATFRFKYGATTLASLTTTLSSGNIRLYGYIELILIADGSTSAQRGTMEMSLGNSLDPDAASQQLIKRLATGTAAEDSTANKNFVLTIQWANASSTHNFIPAGYTIEKLV